MGEVGSSEVLFLLIRNYGLLALRSQLRVFYLLIGKVDQTLVVQLSFKQQDKSLVVQFLSEKLFEQLDLDFAVVEGLEEELLVGVEQLRERDEEPLLQLDIRLVKVYELVVDVVELQEGQEDLQKRQLFVLSLELVCQQ